MSLQRHVLFWLGALLVLCLSLYILRDVLLPFVAGLILAYLIDPAVDRLQRTGLSRLVGTLLILGLFIVGFALIVVVAAPVLAAQLSDFIRKLPDYVVRLQALAVTQGSVLIERFGGTTALNELQSSIGNLVSQGAAWIGRFAQSLWSGGQALIGVFSLLVVTPIVAFYLIVDWDKMLAKIDSWVPPRHRMTVRRLAGEIDTAISGFLRGQALVCLFLAVWYGIGLTLAGLNFGVLIGLISGVLSFIPYVGSLTGLVLSLGIGLVQFWPDPIAIGLVLAVFASGQFIEGNILQPKLVGEAVGLHPVWLMFALLAFGSLAGFVGLLLAVPIAAAIGVLTRYGLSLYMQSPIYTGATTVEHRTQARTESAIVGPAPPTV